MMIQTGGSDSNIGFSITKVFFKSFILHNQARRSKTTSEVATNSMQLSPYNITDT